MFGWLRLIWRLNWRLTKLTWRLLFWVFVLSLPLTWAPLLSGAIEGVLLENQGRANYAASVDNFMSNVESAEAMDWFSVPGGPGIHDVGIAPYFIPQLRHPQTWWQSLGLTRFDVDISDPVAIDETPIDRFASLDVLYRRVRLSQKATPWHHWVYLSAQSFHLDGYFYDQWDEAFDELLRYHYANPSLGEFHFLTCPRSFLCNLWNTNGATLLHFTTESPDVFADDEGDDPAAWRQQVPGYAPVTVRVIEFPVRNPDQASLQPGEYPLMPGVFPSPFEQLRGVTADPHAWQTFPPYHGLRQVFARLDDTCEEAERAWPGTYGRLIRWELYVDKVLGLEDNSWRGLVRFAPLILTSLGLQGVHFGWDLVTSLGQGFLGNGAEDHARVLREETPPMPPVEDNFMAQMLQDFIGSLPEEMSEAMKAPEAAGLMDNMWDAVKRKPAQVDEDEEEFEGAAQ